MTLVVDAPVVKLVASWFHEELLAQVLASPPPVPLAPRYTFWPCTHALSEYEELGCTLTVWLHCAVSLPVGVACRAYEPECTGALTTDPVPPEHDQPDSAPDSKPPLATRFTSDACAPPVATTRPAEPRTAAEAAATSTVFLREARWRCFVSDMSEVLLVCGLRPAGRDLAEDPVRHAPAAGRILRKERTW